MTGSSSLAAHQSPSHWPVVPLRACLRQMKQTGATDLPLLGVSLADGVRLRENDDGRPAASSDLSSYKVVLPGQIIMNALGKPHGSIGVSTVRGITSPAYWVLECAALADARYFHHLLRSDVMIAEYVRLGKNQPPNQFDISWESFRDIVIALPPLTEQRRIADFLDDQVRRIDEIVRLRQEQVTLLPQILSAVIAEVVARKSETVALSRIADVVVSNVDKHIIAGQQPVELCNYTDVYYRRRVRADQEFSQGSATASQVASFELKPGDVLITKDSETAEDIGVPAFVETSKPNLVLGYHCARIRPRDVDGSYLYWMMHSEFVRQQLALAATGITRVGLKLSAISASSIPLLPVAEQPVAAANMWREADGLDALKDRLNASVDLLNEYKRSLITAAVTGEFDVSAASGRGIPV